LYNCPIKELNNEVTIDDLDSPEKYFESGIFKYHRVNNLGKGEFFGETGLVLMQGRSATLLCTKDTQLLTLVKEDFDKCLLEIY
jgi:CRP-like cAMP-binding protein